MKIGITGAAGFIGSNLTDALLAEGHNVIGLDNLSMGSRRNIAHLEHCSRFQFHHVDVRELDKMREVFRSADCIVHLAAYKIPRYGKAIDTLEINSIGSKNVLELGRDGNRPSCWPRHLISTARIQNCHSTKIPTPSSGRQPCLGGRMPSPSCSTNIWLWPINPATAFR